MEANGSNSTKFKKFIVRLHDRRRSLASLYSLRLETNAGVPLVGGTDCGSPSNRPILVSPSEVAFPTYRLKEDGENYECMSVDIDC